MHKLGKKQMKFELQQKLAAIPADARRLQPRSSPTMATRWPTPTRRRAERRGVTRLVEALLRQNIRLKDINTTQSSLEDIFVDLVRKDAPGAQP